jgi:uncharacterized protein (TIGR02996 family)
MLAEDDFQAALDADITNSALRLVLADWLEEQGDERALGYRWLGQNGKWPFDWAKNQGGSEFKTFDWYFPDIFVAWEVPEHCRLPVAIGKAFLTRCHFLGFGTRRGAEDAVCDVLSRFPELRGPCRPSLWRWPWRWRGAKPKLARAR